MFTAAELAWYARGAMIGQPRYEIEPDTGVTDLRSFLANPPEYPTE